MDTALASGTNMACSHNRTDTCHPSQAIKYVAQLADDPELHLEWGKLKGWEARGWPASSSCKGSPQNSCSHVCCCADLQPGDIQLLNNW